MAYGSLAYDNKVDDSTFTSSDFTGTTLANVKTRDLGEVAISNKVSNVIFDMDCGQSVFGRAHALIATNLSPYATIRRIWSNSSSFIDVIYDTGVKNAYPPIYLTSDLEWQDPNWWSGRPSTVDLEGEQRKHIFVHPTQNITARYVRTIIDDPLNPDGYISIGRVFYGPIWLFSTTNMQYGASVAFDSGTLLDETLGRVQKFDVRPLKKTVSFAIPYMTEREAMSKAYDVMRKCDISGELLFIWDFEDSLNSFRRDIWGRLRALGQLEAVSFGYWSAPAFEIEELL
jgi:hypothetical protein